MNIKKYEPHDDTPEVWPNSIAIVDKITGQVWLWVEHLNQWIILQPKKED